MREPIIDDERLAALLDGRLDAGEREALLARIADSDEEYAVFADAAAILRQDEAPAAAATADGDATAEARRTPVARAEPSGARTDGPAVVPMAGRAPSPPPSMASPRRGWGRRAPWLALAAVVAALALIPVLRSRGGDPYDPARLAARVGRLPRDWTAESPFGTTRGGSGAPSVTEEGRAARLGALLVDLEVAVRSRDTAATALYAGRVSTLLDQPGMGPVAAIYAEIDSSAARPGKLAEPLKEGRAGVAELTDEPYRPYREAGAWAEAARLAAHAHDEGFFRTPQSRAAPDRIAALPGLSDTGREAVAGVRRALPEGGVRDWAPLEAALKDLLRALGH